MLFHTTLEPPKTVEIQNPHKKQLEPKNCHLTTELLTFQIYNLQFTIPISIIIHYPFISQLATF
jgi:hypothetical protein